MLAKSPKVAQLGKKTTKFGEVKGYRIGPGGYDCNKLLHHIKKIVFSVLPPGESA